MPVMTWIECTPERPSRSFRKWMGVAAVSEDRDVFIDARAAPQLVFIFALGDGSALVAAPPGSRKERAFLSLNWLVENHTGRDRENYAAIRSRILDAYDASEPLPAGNPSPGRGRGSR